MRALIAWALVFVTAVPCSAAYYATDKGVILAGGSVGFESSDGNLYEDQDGDKATTISFDPFVGYFLVPHFAVGAHLHFSKIVNNRYSHDFDSSEIGFGPALFYYFGREYSKMFPFVSARFDWMKESSSLDTYDPPDRTYATFGFAGGITAMVSKNVGIRTALFYQFDSEKEEGEEKVGGKKIGLRVGIESFIW